MKKAVLLFLIILFVQPVYSDEGTRPTKTQDFKVKNLFGRELSINFYHLPEDERPLMVVHLWAVWCSPCVEEFPEFLDFAKANHKDIHVIAISMSSSKDELYNFIKYLRIVEDREIEHLFMAIGSEDKSSMNDNDASEYYNIQTLPMTLFIDRQGTIAMWHEGSLKWQDKKMRDAMKAFIEGEPIPSLAESSEE